MHSNNPNPKCERQIQNAAQEYPKNIHQHIEATVGTFPATNLFAERPQGKACRVFKVCMPKGMPIMVNIINKLAIRYSTAVMIPPNINHKIFIKQPIAFLFLILNTNIALFI